MAEWTPPEAFAASAVAGGKDNAIDRTSCNTWKALTSDRRPFRTSKHQLYDNSPSRVLLEHSLPTFRQLEARVPQ